MTGEKTLYLAKNYFKMLLLAGLLLGALSFVFLVVTQEKFKVSTDLLVVQNQQGFSDYYALSKSADYLTNVLAESVYSEKFLEEVNNAKIISAVFLPNDKLERLRQWEKIVKISRNPNLGMVHLDVFGNDKNQAMEISNAIVVVMTTKNYSFLGKGQDIDVRVMSGPIWEKNPSLANIFLAVMGGVVAGMMLGFMYLYYREVRLSNLRAKKQERENLENYDWDGSQSPEADEYEEGLEHLNR